MAVGDETWQCSNCAARFVVPVGKKMAGFCVECGWAFHGWNMPKMVSVTISHPPLDLFGSHKEEKMDFDTEHPEKYETNGGNEIAFIFKQPSHFKKFFILAKTEGGDVYEVETDEVRKKQPTIWVIALKNSEGEVLTDAYASRKELDERFETYVKNVNSKYTLIGYKEIKLDEFTK